MEELIGEILTLARDGQPVEQWDAVLLSSKATECWNLVETETATLRFEEDFAFKANPDRVQRLFENLFRNAVDHGGGEVTVTVGALPDESGFYVADDGPGIPEADRDTVFEAGFTTRDEGTGFGLAIVAEVVGAHGWDIQVTESEPGGARFEIRGVETVEFAHAG
jgi:signal transduction histidine kinase